MSSSLDDHNPEQVGMMQEMCILVDESDKPVGKDTKYNCHIGEGKLHRAFSVIIFNSKNEMLIQKRSRDKITFPGVWANACCSHPLHTEQELDGTGVGTKRAAIRKLEQELGIDSSEISTDDLIFMTRMQYEARADAKWIEREIDHILILKKDVITKHNENEIEELKWIPRSEFDDEMSLLEESGEVIAPWFKLICNNFLHDWWDDLENLDRHRDDSIHNFLTSSENLMDVLIEHRVKIEKRIIESLSVTEQERLRSAMLHLIKGGGKRLRAIIPYLVADALGRANEGLYDVGAAIEIIHNFTLVHDDIMDQDEIRRGRPAVHVEYDLPTAINAGDAMLAVGFELISTIDVIPDNELKSLVRVFGNMVRRVSEGQQFDMQFEEMDVVSEEDYLNMISKKTAAMFETCGQVGAMCSLSSEEEIRRMTAWGYNLGMCFQLMDDLIDVISDSKTIGKPAGSDIARGKRTLMIIHAMNQNDSHAKRELMNILGKGGSVSSSEILSAIDALNALGSIEYARAKAMEYHKLAHECLNGLEESKSLDILRELTDLQLTRLS